MAITIVQHTPISTQSSVSPTTLTFGSNITAGSSIVVLTIHSYLATPPGGPGTGGLSDTLGNTYTQRNTAQILNPANQSAGIGYVHTTVSASGGANTVSIPYLAGVTRGCVAFELTGVPTNPYDTQNGNKNTSNPQDGGSVTPAINGSLIIGLFERVGFATYGGATVNTLFTTIFNDAADSASCAYGIQTTAASVTPSINAPATAGYPAYGFTVVLSPSAGGAARTDKFFFGA